MGRARVECGEGGGKQIARVVRKAALSRLSGANACLFHHGGRRGFCLGAHNRITTGAYDRELTLDSIGASAIPRRVLHHLLDWGP